MTPPFISSHILYCLQITLMLLVKSQGFHTFFKSISLPHSRRPANTFQFGKKRSKRRGKKPLLKTITSILPHYLPFGRQRRAERQAAICLHLLYKTIRIIIVFFFQRVALFKGPEVPGRLRKMKSL